MNHHPVPGPPATAPSASRESAMLTALSADGRLRLVAVERVLQLNRNVQIPPDVGELCRDAADLVTYLRDGTLPAEETT